MSSDYVITTIENNFLARMTAEQNCSRLDLMALQPKRIVVLGREPNFCAKLLKKRYPIATVEIGEVENNKILASKVLPVDLIFANLQLPWCENLKLILQEWRQLLGHAGILLFSTLGPDTVVELHEKNLQDMLLYLIDMHDIGDALMTEGFMHPVLDSENINVTYQTLSALTEELQALQILAQDTRVVHLSPIKEKIYSLTFEIIYGHAFGPPSNMSSSDKGVIKIPLANVGKISKNP